ncbi:hypothetical protein [Acinetobacter seifertii]|uniref:Uncharacterized protein n=1 Tax=Acinetobacter seifertii TaxID=1530123 RepID=A0A7L8BM34_9GAMM|nr:hypothetical protein [Acinetobacter seifertii]QOD75203.1 hypothetical protein IC779_14185 [Acinetobacter seifertii]
MTLNNPETIEIHGLKTIHKLCKFGADNNMEGCTFTEILERMFIELEKASAQAAPEHINEIQSWIAVQSTQAMELDGEEFVVGANELAEFIEQLVKSESGAEG